jgi:hypothetical protein
MGNAVFYDFSFINISHNYVSGIGIYLCFQEITQLSPRLSVRTSVIRRLFYNSI